jgi:membrane associated rhomboid family serine protease
LIPFADADVERRSFPVVNVVLIGLNALVFLYELQLSGLALLGGGGDLDVTGFFLKWGFISNELTQGVACTHQWLAINPLRVQEFCPQLPAEFLTSPESKLPVFGPVGGFFLQNIDSPLPTWGTLVSYMFIHGGFFHFAGNMAFLWVLGDNIENRLGHVKYLLFFLVTGVAAALSQMAIDPHSQSPLIGASGAVSGVVGAYLLLYPYNRIRALVIFYFITVVEVRALILLGLWSLWQLIQALFSLGLSNAVNVAFFAHVGGVLAGVVIIAVYKLLTRQPIWPSRQRDQRRQPWDYWYRAGRGPD